MKNRRRNVRPRPRTWEKTSTIVTCVLVAGLAIILVLSLYQRMKSQGAYRQEYAGRVMDKWVTYHESEQGTGFGRHLLIKSKNGEVFQVSVGRELYEQAKVDNWVIKDKDGVRFLSAEP